MKNQFYSIKAVKAKNLNSVFNKNPSYKKITKYDGYPIRYDFTPNPSLNYDVLDQGMIIGKYEETRIYLLNENYGFIVTGYKYKFCMESAEIVDSIIGRVILNAEDFINHPEAEVLNHILKDYKYEDTITLVEPENSITINLKDQDEVQKFVTGYKNGDNSNFFLYSFDTNLSLDSDVLQQLKTISECGWLNDEVQPDLPLIPINDSLYQISGKYGTAIVMHGQEKYNIGYALPEFLKGLMQTIYTRFEADNNDKLLDNGLENQKDLESIKSSALKNLRKIVHVKNEIKRSKNQSIEKNIYNIYMETGPFSSLIDDFEESCTSIKDELEIESERREAKRSSMFDKTLAIIGIMALVSAFKDGSDLNITGLEMFNNPIMIGFIDLIKIASPIICLVLIVILVIFVFKKK